MFITKFKDFVKKCVTVVASREFAFIYCLLGTFGEVAHCYFLLDSVSSFSGFFKHFQAGILSLFISSSLMYFVSISDSSDEETEQKRIKRAVNLFMIMEILMNMYYYCQHLIIKAETMRIFDFIFGTVISCLIPVTIKLYSNSIKAKQWIAEIESQKTNNSENPNQPNISQVPGLTESEVQEIAKNVVEEKIQDFQPTIDKEQVQKTIDEVLDERLKSLPEGDGYSVDDLLFESKLKSIVEAKVNEVLKQNPDVKTREVLKNLVIEQFEKIQKNSQEYIDKKLEEK